MPRRSDMTIDWDGIGTEYIAGEVTLTQLAKTHGVNYSKLWLQCKDGEWNKKRDKFRKERAKKVQEDVMAEASRVVVARFRTSEAIRADLHFISNHVAGRIKNLFIDPNTGKPKRVQPTARVLKDTVETLERVFKLEMLSGGHPLEPEVMNINAKVLIAGVSLEQIQQLPDEQLDQVINVAVQAAKLPESKDEP